MLSGAMIFGLFQFPFEVPKSAPTLKEVGVPTQLEAGVGKKEIKLAEVFFGVEAKKKATEEMIDKKIAYVSTRPAFPASLAVIKKHEKTIKSIAREKGVPEEVAIGVALLENGGSETAVSSAGALGVFQLMPATARGLGLTVNKKVDQRKNPKRNIEAGITYLKSNYERFGDWGLATWAYHAGEGNVGKALKIYKQNGGKGTPTIHKLLSHPQVKKFTKKLNDDSAGYPYKVIATSELFESASHGASILPGIIVDRI